MLLALACEERIKHPTVMDEDLIKVVKHLCHESLDAVLRHGGCIDERVDENLLDELEISHIIALGLDDFEQDGLPLDFFLVEHFAGLGRDKPIPFFIVLIQLACLKAAKGFLGVKTGAYI